MKPKERVLASLHHEKPDRIPTGENSVDGELVDQILGENVLFNKGWDELNAVWNGKRDEVVRDYCLVHEKLPQALEWDYVRVPVVPAAKEYSPPEKTGEYSWITEEGHEVHFKPEAGNIISRSHYPDLTIDDLPDPDGPFEIDSTTLEAIKHVVKTIGETRFIIARTPFDGTFPWEQTVGMEAFLMKMVLDQDFVEKAVQVWVNRCIVYIDAMLDAGVDGIMTTDDYSDNRGPIMGVELFRKFIIPGIRKQCEAIHAKGGYFIKHTDGNLWDVLDDFVEIGIDGWHGIQRNIGMDLKELKKRYGSNLCFFGGVNTETIINGSKQEVEEEVRSAIEAAGSGGGLVLTCSNVVPPGAKLENYYAMREAIKRYGS